MKLTDVFPTPYLKAADIDGNREVTISKVTIEELGIDRDRKAVAYFKHETKGLVLNKTNASMLAAICGSDDTDNWVGHTALLYTELVAFQGRTAPAIRVRQPLVTQERVRAKPVPASSGGNIDDDAIPF